MRILSQFSALALTAALGLAAPVALAQQAPAEPAPQATPAPAPEVGEGGLSLPPAAGQVETGLRLPRAPSEAEAEAAAAAATPPAAPAAPAAVAPAAAAPAATAMDPATVPVLAPLLRNGATVTALGPAHGMNGWIVRHGTEVQSLYTTADGQAVVAGLMYGSDGMAVTAQQLLALEQAGTNLTALAPAAAPKPSIEQMALEAARKTEELAQQTIAAINEPLPPDLLEAAGMAPTPAAPTATAPATAPQLAPTPASTGVAATAQPAATAASSAATSPAETFLAAASRSAWIEIGQRNAPELYIFVDPACAYCKAYWRQLAAPVERGEVKVRLLPVGMISDASPDMASVLLGSRDPGKTWIDVANGNANAVAGQAPPAMLTHVIDNTKLLFDHNITSVPFSVYRTPQGRVMVVAGQPPDLGAVLSSLRGR